MEFVAGCVSLFISDFDALWQWIMCQSLVGKYISHLLQEGINLLVACMVEWGMGALHCVGPVKAKSVLVYNVEIAKLCQLQISDYND